MKCHQTEQSSKECSAAGYTYPKGRLLLSCFGLAKISGFLITKTSANKRFLLCLLPSTADVRHPSAQVHGTKVQQNLRMCKKIAKNRYFLDNGRPGGLWDGVPPIGYGSLLPWYTYTYLSCIYRISTVYLP